MADFVAVLNKTIDGLGERNTPEMRQKVYERAKKAVADKLAAITPPPTAAQSGRQFKMLEEAISSVEASYAPIKPVHVSAPTIKAVAADPLADFLASVESEGIKPSAQTESKSAVDGVVIDPVYPTAANTAKVGFDTTDPVLGRDHHEPLSIPNGDFLTKPTKKSGGSSLLFGLLGLLVIGGAGYTGYLYKDQIQEYLGSSTQKVPAADPAAAKTEPVAEPQKTTEVPAEPAKPAGESDTPKLTQRLNADGTEVDAGPGAQPQDVGEGATVATATTPPSQTPVAPAAEPTPTAPATPVVPAQTIAVGQKVIFYEEKTGTEQGTADQGAVVWSVVQDSPGLDQPTEPAIRGEITVPDKGLNIKLTIKRNLDKSLPASHIIEMLFTTPADFASGTIETVQRFAMKDTEQAPGNPLVGVPASLGDGFFLIALTDEKSAIDTNLSLLSKQQWIDIPVAYGSGKRALLSFEKGIPGDKVFQEVIKSWETKAASGG
jgi:hypothetical protein